MPALDGLFVEVEFVPGSWTDVSSWVDWSAGLSTKFGRSQPQEAPQSATMTLTLDNTDGRFSPLTQVLADQVTAHPYWPNVVPRRRIRFGYVVGAARYMRFTGYINGWPPVFKGRGRRVTLSASDRLSQLAQINLGNPYALEVNADAPLFYWPMTEPEGSTAAAEANGGRGLVTVYAATGPAVAPVFGIDGPEQGAGTAVKFSSANGSILSLASGPRVRNPLTSMTLEAWANIPAMPAALQSIASVFDLATGACLELAVTSGGAVFGLVITPSGTSIATSAVGPVVGPVWGHFALTFTASGTLNFYVSGSLVSSTTVGAMTLNPTSVTVGYGLDAGSFGTVLDGTVNQVALYPTALTAGRLLTHTKSGVAWHNGIETVDQRIARFLAIANVTSTVLDPSTVQLNSYPQAGQSVLNACQDMAVTEGDGAVVYIDPNDVATFRARRTGQTGVPDVVLDSVGDLVGDTWAPSYDADQLANSSTVTRSTLSGDATVQTVVDAGSITSYGLTSDDFTTYTADDVDALSNAQQRLAARSQPRFRLSQVTVDLLTAQTPTLCVDVADAWIGSLLRITNLDPGAAPTSTTDLIVQGWADAVSDAGYTITFDTSPAPNPLVIADDATYGDAAPQDTTLSSAISRTATTLVLKVAFAGEEQLSTAAGDYPMTLLVGQERITLSGPPSSSTSTTQTFTGVTRGAGGTAPAAQPAGSNVDLWPLVVAAL